MINLLLFPLTKLKIILLLFVKHIILSGYFQKSVLMSAIDPNDIINKNSDLCNKYDLKLDPKQLELPYMYWIPKKHKVPRFLDYYMIK